MIAPRLAGNTRRVLHVRGRHGERLVKARAKLNGKALKVRGRSVVVDLRGARPGTYKVHITAKYVRADGTTRVAQSTRTLKVRFA